MNKRKNDFLAYRLPRWVWVMAPVLLITMGAMGLLIGQQLARQNIYLIESAVIAPGLPYPNKVTVMAGSSAQDAAQLASSAAEEAKIAADAAKIVADEAKLVAQDAQAANIAAQNATAAGNASAVAANSRLTADNAKTAAENAKLVAQNAALVRPDVNNKGAGQS